MSCLVPDNGGLVGSVRMTGIVVYFVPTANHTWEVALSKLHNILGLIVFIIFFISSACKVCLTPKKPARGPFLHHMSRQLPRTWYSSPPFILGCSWDY